MFSSNWNRPSTLGPQVWHRFERTTKDNKTIKFRVQDITEEYYDDVIELAKKDYIRDEPWAKNSQIADDPASMEIFMKFYKYHVLPQSVSLICMEDDDKISKPKLVGFNMLGVCLKEDIEDFNEFIKSKHTETLMFIYGTFKQHCPNIYEKYNTDKYLAAIGLCVGSEYRGMNISAEILKARIPLCKALGIKITNTIFTATASQKCAVKAGFEEDASVSYDELRAATGLKFENCIDCKMMTLKIE